jgi:hypothetical protein
VRDANGQALSYVYYENKPGRRSAAKLLSDDEARRIGAFSLAWHSSPFFRTTDHMLSGPKWWWLFPWWHHLGHVFDTFPILKAVPPDEDFPCINITQPNFKFI